MPSPSLRAALLAFYRHSARDLPWRRTRDPYAIWVSEIMLQQTQVVTVVPRWHAFLARFPTVAALAAASEGDVCCAWAGLGYYRRARLLHAAARQVVDRHGGVVPADPAALLALPGVGRYTAGAIASIAFGIPAPLVDGNVERVLARVHAVGQPLATPAGRQQLWALATDLVAGERPGDLNQALMELGATLCRVTRPQCLLCPVRRHCRAFCDGTQAQFPVAVARRPPTPMSVAFAYVVGRRGTWLVRRPLTGLWAGLWEPPSAAADTCAGAAKALADRLGPLGPALARVGHALTHRRISATLYPLLRPRLRAGDGLQAYADPLGAPLSALARKAILAAQRASAAALPAG